MTSLKQIKKCFSETTRKVRQTLHRCEMIEKKAKRRLDYVKSRHICPKELSKGHKVWSIKAREV